MTAQGEPMPHLKIVVAHAELAHRLDILKEEAGPAVEWVCCSSSDADALGALLSDADVFVSSTLSRSMAKNAQGLRLVHATGAGVDKIEMDAVPQAIIANAYNHGRSIAEFVVLCMLALSRQFLPSDRDMRRDIWRSTLYDPAIPLRRTLTGRRVGIVGFGEVGKAVSKMAVLLGMTVCAVKTRAVPAAELEDGIEWIGGADDLPRLLETSDFIVVAVPLTDATRGLISTAQLARMTPTAHLINVARGPVVDERALFTALASRQIAGAAIDVWWNYPSDSNVCAPATEDFASLDNVIMSPHASGMTNETFDGRARTIGQNVRRLAEGKPLVNVVRPAAAPGANRG